MNLKYYFATSCLLAGMAFSSAAAHTVPTADGNKDSNPTIVPGTKKITVQGVVVDDNGEPLIGATIYEKESANGTTTDIDGHFSLNVDKDAVITVHYLGFAEKLVNTKGNNPLSIKLEKDTHLLDDVVVVGYGTQKKINMSGAVDQLTAKDIEKRPINDLSRGLQGMIPNLNIDFTSGEPGKAATLNIRGEASINGGSPLILIDGVAADAEEMNRLMPGDIESISVLKDAASAAIYGARAAFGVILITTKQGSGDRISVSYNGNAQWRRPSQLTDKTSDPYIYLKLKNIAVLNTPWSSGHVTSDERLEWARQRSDNPSGTEAIRLDPLDNTQWDYMGNRDWTRYFLDRSTFAQSHQLSVSGATARTNFYISAGYDGEDGVLSRIASDDTYKRYSTRGKVRYNISDWFNVSNNTSFVMTKRNKPSYYNLDALYDAKPSDVDVNTDGTWANTDLGKALAQIADGGKESTTDMRLQSTFAAELSLWNKMLKLNGDFTFALGHEDYDWYRTKYNIGYGPQDIRTDGTSQAYKGNTSTLYTVLDLYATFNKQFGKHALTTVLGFNQEYNRSDNFTANRYDIIASALPSIALSSGDQYVGQTYKDWAIRGLYYRLNYIFNDRYILELDGRYDGTSRFPKNKRFGFFPSGSLAWRVDAEPFFQPLTRYISQLKLRASYGSLGNQLVSEYGYIPAMASKTGSYIIDGKLQQIVSSPALVSPSYTWEKVRTINAGIDIALLQNRLTMSFDIYRRDTRDMLTKGKELPGLLGANEPNENAADMKTTGWELSVGYRDQFKLAGKPFAWNARFILSDNRSWITRFDNPDRKLGQYYKGMEIGEIWGLTNDGMFQSKEEIARLDETQIIPWGALTIVEGWPKYKDLDGDHTITKGTTADHPGDLSRIGNSSPRYRFGLNLGAEWNGFDLSVFVQGIAKRDYYPLSYLYWSFYQQPYAGGQKHAFDFYRATDDTPEQMAKHSKSYIAAGLANKNTNSMYPVFQSWLADKNLGTGITSAMGLAIPQTKYLLNGAYMRLKNITVGYTLPSKLTNRLHINRIRVYASADNLFEISALKKYFDPEAVTNSDSYGYVYPFNRQYTVGVNVTF